MSPNGSVHWHALYVASRCEKVVATRLNALNIEAIVPTQKQWRQWSDRKKLMEVILFPNYVFLATDLKRREEPLKLKQVVQYVRFGGQIARLSKKEVELIRQIGNYTRPVEIISGTLSPGEMVEITSGPLHSFHGRILSVNGGTRLQIEIPSLQCFAQVKVGMGEVRRVVG